MQLSQSREHFLAVRGRLYTLESFGNPSIRIDDEGIAQRNWLPLVLAKRTIEFRDFVFGICQQFKIQPFLGAEFLVGICSIHADPDDDGTQLFIPGEVALEIVRFQGTAGREVCNLQTGLQSALAPNILFPATVVMIPNDPLCGCGHCQPQCCSSCTDRLSELIP